MKKYGVIVKMEDIPDDIRSTKALFQAGIEIRNRLMTSFNKRL